MSLPRTEALMNRDAASWTSSVQDRALVVNNDYLFLIRLVASFRSKNSE